jgi:F420-non-reducing hydrogenase iron-sulfur subunit
MGIPKVVVFTCNWNAYSGLERAGIQRLSYSPNIFPLRVKCLGQLSSGIILKAFEKGAKGVLMLGCPPGECHFEFGNKRAEEVFEETRRLIELLGFKDEQFKFDWVAAGEAEVFVNKVEVFIAGLDGTRVHDG